jgi:hypothetical protein
MCMSYKDKNKLKHNCIIKMTGMTNYRNVLIKSTMVQYIYIYGGPLMVAQWLRYCATNRKVADSIPVGVIGIFH